MSDYIRIGKQHLELICSEHGQPDQRVSHWIKPLRTFARAIVENGKVISHEFASDPEKGPWIRCTTPPTEAATSYGDQREVSST